MPSSIINALSLCLALGSGVSAWTMAAHDTDKCGASANNFNYYSLESDSGSYSGCIAFPSIPSDVDCTFFTNGGDSSGECSQDTFSRATSFTLHDGICNVYADDKCSGSPMFASTAVDCGANSAADGSPRGWGSFSCRNA